MGMKRRKREKSNIHVIGSTPDVSAIKTQWQRKEDEQKKNRTIRVQKKRKDKKKGFPSEIKTPKIVSSLHIVDYTAQISSMVVTFL